jgi:hypothetical protein
MLLSVYIALLRGCSSSIVTGSSSGFVKKGDGSPEMDKLLFVQLF